ncbi:MAG: DNA polymerase Y family protein [Steroidobacteraceae bacterium]
MHARSGRSPFAVRGSPGGSKAAAELWLAIHLPTLAFDAACRGSEDTGSIVVVDLVQRMQRVIALGAAARARGVAPGQALATALALEPRLVIRPRDPGAERALLGHLAMAAGELTPRVSVEPPDGVLLEVRGSLALFGGVDALCGKARAAARRAGVRVRLALAPTPLAALAGARALRGRGRADFRVMRRAELVGALAPLSLAVLRLPEEVLDRLAKTGVTTIGQVLRLPRAGLARRFGPPTLAALDRLVGREAEPRRSVASRGRYRVRREPSCELTDQPAILTFLSAMLAELEAFLRSRQGSITVLECRLHHRGGAAMRCRLRFAEPAFAAAAIHFLLGERLAATALAAPVIACELISGRLVPRHSASAALWRPGEHGGSLAHEAPALIERLRARLGEESVYGLCLVPEHRPERSERRVANSGQPEAAASPPRATARSGRSLPAVRCSLGGGFAAAERPLWLLATPLLLPSSGGWPQYEGPLDRLAGPERIETGWWDGGDVTRDYYVMRNPAAARLWVYRERHPPHEWFLHGVFG